MAVLTRPFCRHDLGSGPACVRCLDSGARLRGGRWDFHAAATRAGVLRRRITINKRCVAFKDNETEQPSTAAAAATAVTTCARTHISVQRRIAFGEVLKVVGGSPQLGGWNPDEAPTMTWTDGDVWVLDIELPADSTIEFKCVVVRQDGSAAWDGGDNRSVTVPSSAANDSTRVVIDVVADATSLKSVADMNGHDTSTSSESDTQEHDDSTLLQDDTQLTSSAAENVLDDVAQHYGSDNGSENGSDAEASQEPGTVLYAEDEATTDIPEPSIGVENGATYEVVEAEIAQQDAAERAGDVDATATTELPRAHVRLLSALDQFAPQPAAPSPQLESSLHLHPDVAPTQDAQPASPSGFDDHSVAEASSHAQDLTAPYEEPTTTPMTEAQQSVAKEDSPAQAASNVVEAANTVVQQPAAEVSQRTQQTAQQTQHAVANASQSRVEAFESAKEEASRAVTEGSQGGERVAAVALLASTPFIAWSQFNILNYGASLSSTSQPLLQAAEFGSYAAAAAVCAWAVTRRSDGTREGGVSALARAAALAVVGMSLAGVGYEVFVAGINPFEPHTPIPQLQSQLDAVSSQLNNFNPSGFKLPSVDLPRDWSLPSLNADSVKSAIKVPEVKLPEVALPQVKLPDVDLKAVKLPQTDLKLPQFAFKAPSWDFKLPEVDVKLPTWNEVMQTAAVQQLTSFADGAVDSLRQLPGDVTQSGLVKQLESLTSNAVSSLQQLPNDVMRSDFVKDVMSFTDSAVGAVRQLPGDVISSEPVKDVTSLADSAVSTLKQLPGDVISSEPVKDTTSLADSAVNTLKQLPGDVVSSEPAKAVTSLTDDAVNTLKQLPDDIIRSEAVKDVTSLADSAVNTIKQLPGDVMQSEPVKQAEALTDSAVNTLKNTNVPDVSSAQRAVQRTTEEIISATKTTTRKLL